MTGSGRVERTLFRALARLANTFDRSPALKALICRNHGLPLPEPLDSLVARFLGSPHLGYYWPPPNQPAPRVQDAVRTAFRQPPEGGGLEAAFMGLRYLSGLLAVARKHGMMADAAAAAAGPGRGGGEGWRQGHEQQQQQQQQEQQQQAGLAAGAPAASAAAAGPDEPSSSSGGSDGSGLKGASGVRRASEPARGLVLVAHPCLAGNIFSRSVVLVCRHDSGGSYGLILNKPLGSSLQHLHERLRQLQGGGGGGGGGEAGTAPASPSGLLFGGGPGGTWEASAPPTASLGAAVHSLEVSQDMPAEQLQQVVDFLQWRQEEMRGVAAAAVAAEASQPEHDEYGNWIERSYEELDSEQEQFDQVNSESDSEDDDSWAQADVTYLSDADLGAGAGSGGAAGAAAAELGAGQRGEGAKPDVDLVMHEVMQALRNITGAGPADEWGVSPLDDAEGLVDSMRDLLHKVGGGSIIVLDPRGQVWSHHLSSQAGGASEDASWAIGMSGVETYADDEPGSVAGLVMSCLTPKDRLLLAHQERLALEGQLLAAGGAGDGAAAAAGQQAEQAVGGSRGRTSGKGMLRARQLRQRVEQLLISVPPAAPGQPEQQRAGQPLPGPLNAAASFATSLFGTGPDPGSSSGSGSGSGSAAEAGGGAAAGGTTVTELMAVFKESPLFRGGPVPGVQVLHQRPRLGGQLVLPPWGSDASQAPGEQAQQAQQAAAAAAEGGSGAAAAVDGQQMEALEGGLAVGADLARAQGLIEEGYLQPGDVRVCMGDSGWSAVQLEAEVERGTWAVISAPPAFLDLFGPAATQASRLGPDSSNSSSSGEGGSGSSGGTSTGSTSAADSTAAAVLSYETDMWAKCLSALGPEYAALAQVPKGVWEDLADLEV